MTVFHYQGAITRQLLQHDRVLSTVLTGVVGRVGQVWRMSVVLDGSSEAADQLIVLSFPSVVVASCRW